MRWESSREDGVRICSEFQRYSSVGKHINRYDFRSRSNLIPSTTAQSPASPSLVDDFHPYICQTIIEKVKFTLAILSSLVASVLAYTPPTNQADGGYVVTFDESGNPVTSREFVPEVEARAPRAAPAVAKRAFPSYDSACTGRSIDVRSYAGAQRCMNEFLNRYGGQSRTGRAVYYCRDGDALLAVCQYGETLGGNSGEIDEFNGIMDNKCSAYKSGWVFIGPWNKTYWRTTWGETICGNLDGPRYSITP